MDSAVQAAAPVARSRAALASARPLAPATGLNQARWGAPALAMRAPRARSPVTPAAASPASIPDTAGAAKLVPFQPTSELPFQLVIPSPGARTSTSPVL